MKDRDEKGMGGKMNPAKVEQFLRGVSFPATKSELVEMAGQNEAPEEITMALNGLPERDYQSPAEVSKELGNKM